MSILPKPERFLNQTKTKNIYKPLCLVWVGVKTKNIYKPLCLVWVGVKTKIFSLVACCEQLEDIREQLKEMRWFE